MKHSLLLPFLLILSANSFAQKKQVNQQSQLQQAIMDEGRRLYNLEMTSTLAINIYKKELKHLKDSTGGYFSYKDKNLNKCVFFNNMYDAGIIATITFDSTFNTKRIAVNTTSRVMTANEKDIYTIRQRAIDQLKRDTSYFKIYSNTVTSILPLIENTTRKVFVLTKSLDSSAVVFGNDYVFDFDNANYIITRKSLHTDLIAIDCISKDSKQEEDIKKIQHKHTVETGDYITSTDVCTLLLNQKYANWSHHAVVGQTYVSLWYCDTSDFDVVPTKKWNKNRKKETEETEQPVAMKNK